MTIFLKLLFNGTDYTFKRDGEIYLLKGIVIWRAFSKNKLITLKNRTIDKVTDMIPRSSKSGH